MCCYALTNTLAVCRQTCKTLPKIRSVLAVPLQQQQRKLSVCNEDEEQKGLFTKDLAEEPWDPNPHQYKWESVWENPKCCKPECDVFRHDILFLKETPKKYTRTWIECGEVEKMVWDCSGEIEPPEIQPRSPPQCKEEISRNRCKACVGDENSLGLMTCKPFPTLTGPCVKVRVPCCKPVRDPPKCEKVAIHKCCQKRCALYPAFSECQRDKLPVPRPIECKCMKVPSMCEVYAQFRKFAVK